MQNKRRYWHSVWIAQIRAVLWRNDGSFTTWVYLYPVGLLSISTQLLDYFGLLSFCISFSTWTVRKSNWWASCLKHRVLSWDWGMFQVIETNTCLLNILTTWYARKYMKENLLCACKNQCLKINAKVLFACSCLNYIHMGI